MRREKVRIRLRDINIGSRHFRSAIVFILIFAMVLGSTAVSFADADFAVTDYDAYPGFTGDYGTGEVYPDNNETGDTNFDTVYVPEPGFGNDETNHEDIVIPDGNEQYVPDVGTEDNNAGAENEYVVIDEPVFDSNSAEAEPNITFSFGDLEIAMEELHSGTEVEALLLRGVTAFDEQGNDVTHLVAVHDDGGFRAYWQNYHRLYRHT